MIYSMTAFARAHRQGPWGSAVCELKSVNHRYLELRVQLPDSLFLLEQPMQEYFRKKLKRGKVDCYFKVQLGEAGEQALALNLNLAKRLIAAGRELSQLAPEVTALAPMELLKWPGVIQTKEQDLEVVQKELLSLLEVAVEELLSARLREGQELKAIFLKRLDVMRGELEKAKGRLPVILVEQRERLTKHFTEAQLSMDPQRLEQEMLMFTQKIDVIEEIERIETHLGEVERTLKQGGLIGRRLDFLMQELNREANTLGSKSVDVSTTQVSLELKVLIEQLREQMQNIE